MRLMPQWRGAFGASPEARSWVHMHALGPAALLRAAALPRADPSMQTPLQAPGFRPTRTLWGSTAAYERMAMPLDRSYQ